MYRLFSFRRPSLRQSHFGLPVSTCSRSEYAHSGPRSRSKTEFVIYRAGSRRNIVFRIIRKAVQTGISGVKTAALTSDRCGLKEQIPAFRRGGEIRIVLCMERCASQKEPGRQHSVSNPFQRRFPPKIQRITLASPGTIPRKNYLSALADCWLCRICALNLRDSGKPLRQSGAVPAEHREGRQAACKRHPR